MILLVAPRPIFIEGESLVAFATSGGLGMVGVVVHVGSVPDSGNLVK